MLFRSAAAQGRTAAISGGGNHGLALVPSGVLVVREDVGPQSIPNAVTDVSAGPVTEASQVVSFLVANDNNSLFSGQPAIAGNGTLTFTPAANANGSATVTVIAVDNGGAPGVSNSAPQTFTITVTPVNDAPSFSLSGTNVTVYPPDGGVVIRANWVTNILAGPPDEAAQTVSFTITNSDHTLFVDQPVVLANGTLEFTPEPTASGVVTVGLRAVDNGGTANGGVDTSAWRTFTITLARTKVFVSASPTVVSGDSVVVPLSLAGAGTENGVSFTLTYDYWPWLEFDTVAVEDGSGLSLYWNEPLTGNTPGAPASYYDIYLNHTPRRGEVGIVVAKPAGATFPAGTNALVFVTFRMHAGTPPTNVSLGFGGAVFIQQVADVAANVISNVHYVGGSVSIVATSPLEGDVTPRENGSGSVTVSDAVQIGRFVAGLDPLTSYGPNSEFQRADCAPRGSLGDGAVTLIDWVQALRYAAGLDPATAVGGPTMRAAAVAASSPRLATGGRAVRVLGGNFTAGRANPVTIQLDALGNEAGVSLSVNFDPSALAFVNATAGPGASTGTLMVNSTKAVAGRVGLVLVLPAGTSIPAGTRDIITLTFDAARVAGITTLGLSGDVPVRREVADVNAGLLGASFLDANFNLLLPIGLRATGVERTADGALRLMIGNTDGSPVTALQATKYSVYVTSDLGGVWTLLPNALRVEDGVLKIVDPAGNGAGLRFYKLEEVP